MKRFFHTILIFLVSSQVFSQNVSFEWAKSIGGSAHDYGQSITTDVVGNIYITGIYQNTVDFDPGVGVFNLKGNNGFEIFILKLDNSGNLIWAKSVTGNSAWDEGRSITIDASGNVIITGVYIGIVDFDPGSATFNMTSNGIRDIFILKLDANGNFIWAKSIGGPSNDYSSSISTDFSNNIYLTGYYSDSADFDPGSTTFNLVSQGSDDIFVQKLDSSGNFIWAKSMGGNLGDQSYSITTDAKNNVFVTGIYRDTADFDPSTSIFNMISQGMWDVFVQKMDSSGSFIWAKSIGGTQGETGSSIITDGMGSVYVTGHYQGTTDFDPSSFTYNLNSNGNYDVFILKLDFSGNFVWVKSVVTNTLHLGYSIAIDQLRNLYVTGRYNSDIFILKLDSSGNSTWTKFIVGTSTNIGQSITINDSGNVYTTGLYSGTADFNPDSAISNFTSNGGYDIFIMKLGQCNSNKGIDVISTCDSITWINGQTYSSSNNTATHSLTNVNGCDSVVTLNLTIDTVDVSVTQAGSKITSNAIGASYQWLDCSNNFALISGKIAQSFTASTNGDFAVEVTENTCIDTSKCVTITTLGIEIDPMFNRVSFYPNPTNGLVNIDFGNLKKVSIKVFSSRGQLIYHQENITTFMHQFELKTAPGIYILELSAQGEKQQYKLLKK